MAFHRWFQTDKCPGKDAQGRCLQRSPLSKKKKKKMTSKSLRVVFPELKIKKKAVVTSGHP